MKGIVSEGRKGFSTYIDGTQFAIVDRAFSHLLEEGEEWEFSEVRKIRDRKGNLIPIVKPEKRIEKVLFKDGKVVIRSGEVVIDEMSIEEALQKGIVRKEEEKISKLPFVRGNKRIKFVSKDDCGYVFQPIPLTETEKKLIEEDRQKWESFLNREEFRKEYEKIEELERRKESLESEIEKLTEELNSHRETFYRDDFDFNAFRKEYLFVLGDDGEVKAYEVTKDTSPRVPNMYLTSDYYERDVDYREVDWDSVPFDKEDVKRKLLHIKEENEKATLNVRKRIRELQEQLDLVKRQLEEVDEEKARLYAIYKNWVKRGFDDLCVKLYDKVVPDEEFRKMLPFKVKSPQGLAVALVYFHAVPESLVSAIPEYAEEVSEVTEAFVNWFTQKWNSERELEDEIEIVCPYCEGKGSIEVLDWNGETNRDYNKEEVCSYCDGLGYKIVDREELQELLKEFSEEELGLEKDDEVKEEEDNSLGIDEIEM